jgi:Fe2+ transport system protein FeoA
MKLAEAKEGRGFVVTHITGDDVTLQALRFGIDAGTAIFVEKNIAGGPVIICKNQLEIAIGREIAAAIEVTPGG